MSRLGEILRRRGLLTAEQLTLESGTPAVELVRRGLVADEVLVEALADEYGLTIVDPRTADVPRAALDAVPHALARRRQLVPIALAGSTLTVAMADPTITVAVEEVKFLCGLDVRVVVAGAMAVREAIDRLYGDAPELADALSELGPAVPDVDRTDDGVLDEAATAQAPVVRFVNALLAEAVARRASDIHIEPYADALRVRLRVDGVLCEVAPPPGALAGAITNRVKVMAQLDIAERRLPQDGRLRLRLSGGTDADVRVSVLPTLFGETLVLRILDGARRERRLEAVGLDADALALFRAALARPHGLILATGPTGSGKTTTLYAALAALDTATVNVCTVEDPVEVHMPGINQVQVRDDIGLNFATALRGLLRQDPDVIMVGEIRDMETADIAVKAALTGHLVLSTLHTNDAASAITRLLDMGIPPFLVAGSLALVVAQRLVRVVCTRCGRDSPMAVDVLHAAGWRDAPFTARRGDGCLECGGTGYRGRVAVHELMPIGDALREHVVGGASPLELGRIARSNGMRTLRQLALRLAARGITSIEEVLRVTPVDADETD